MPVEYVNIKIYDDSFPSEVLKWDKRDYICVAGHMEHIYQHTAYNRDI